MKKTTSRKGAKAQRLDAAARSIEDRKLSQPIPPHTGIKPIPKCVHGKSLDDKCPKCQRMIGELVNHPQRRNPRKA
jgi:hypothetical protein